MPTRTPAKLRNERIRQAHAEKRKRHRAAIANYKSRSQRTKAQKPRQLWLGNRENGNWLEWIAVPGLPDEGPDAIMAHGEAFILTPERSRHMAAWLLDYAAWVESLAPDAFYRPTIIEKHTKPRSRRTPGYMGPDYRSWDVR